MPIPLLRHAAALVLTAALLAACGGGDDSKDAAPDPTTEPTAATPGAEGTGPERPAPGGRKQPGLKTAPLPVGGSAEPVGQEIQCVPVGWSGAEKAGLQPGIRVTNVKVALNQGVVTGSCDDKPHCDGYTFTANDGGCAVKVRVPPGTALLSATGDVVCELSAAECRSFLGALVPQSIQVVGPHKSDEPAQPESPAQSEEPAKPEPSHSG